MLRQIQPPAERHTVGLRWLTHNRRKCENGQVVYIRNSLPRIMGSAHSHRIELLTWSLENPKAVRTQAVIKKRRL